MPPATAFAPLLVAWPSEFVLHESANTIAVYKPHGMIVHGGADAPGGDVVSRLEETSGGSERRSRWRPGLVIERRASGVVLLTRSVERQKELMAAAAQGNVHWRYLAAVRDAGLADLGVVPGLSERGARPPSARYRRVARGRGGALLELETNAPPPHELCRALARMGAPVVGDSVGPTAFRLMLHAESLSVPGLGELTSPPPAALRQSVVGSSDELPEARALHLALLEAGCKRRALARDGSVYRLVNDLGDALPGVVIDRYADWAVLSLSTPQAFASEQALAEALIAVGARGVYVKRRVRADLRRVARESLAPEWPLVGESAPDRLIVREGRLRYVVRLSRGLATGLYPDQRDNRYRLFELAPGARVLNLFAYTGSFSVAAAKAGARTVTTLDLSNRALDGARENFTENGLDPALHRFVRADAMRWLASGTERYDLAVIDPPSFSTSGRGQVFTVAGRYVELATLTLRRLAPRGRLLAVTHQRSASQDALRAMLFEASRRAGVQVAQMRDVPQQLDCPPYADGPSPSRSAWVTLR